MVLRGVEELGDGAARHGLGEVEALAPVASEGSQLLVLLRGLDALARHLQAERLREGDDRVHDGGVLGVVPEAVDERAIDLQAVDREVLDGAEAREACAEVVDGQAHAQVLERLQRPDGRLGFWIMLLSVISRLSRAGSSPV